MLKLRTYIIILSFLIASNLKAQVPTVQDCLGAIPICQNTYSTTTSYFGMGNYPNEVSLNNCLYLGGEANSVWYVFTVQSPGMFRFVLTPNSSGDDYDWAVFNLTNYSCANIYSTPSMMVSCNASGYTGATGISTPLGGTGHSNGPNYTNKFNQDLPVQAGETYVLMISNWSNGTPGYTINFGSSTAQIFDNVAPSINQITSTINCGASSLTFNFTENILCTTIAACDLTLTGPGGPYTITGISGAGCNVGGKQEKTFNLTFTPPMTTGGTYSLNLDAGACGSVTDLCGNVAPSGSLSFNVNLVTATVSTTVAACATPNGSATVTASGGTGGYTYLWNTNPPQTTATATNLYSGTYTVTVYNGACSAVATGVVGTTSNMTATINSAINATCNQPNGGTSVAVIGGTPPLTYLWSTTPAQTTASVSGLYPGTYTVTVTDANLCTATAHALVMQLEPPPSLSLTGTNVLCFGNATGAANLTVTGGTPGFSYAWSNGSILQYLSGLVAGTYSVTVTDAINCTATASITITQPSAALSSSVVPTHIPCNGGMVGSADLSVIGGTTPYAYTWSNGATTQDLNNIPAGPYSVTITDNNNCTVFQNVTINQPAQLSINLAINNVACFGENNGSATSFMGGGTQPYVYTWSPPGTAGNSSSANSLSVGNYTLNVSDQNNCTVDTAFSITEPPLLTFSYSSTDVICNGGNDGSISIIANGGSPPYIYTWSPQVTTTSSAANLSAGTYSITVSDQNLCDTVLTLIISEPPPIIPVTTGNDTVCFGQSFAIGVSAVGGASPYAFNWDNNLGTGDSFTLVASITTTYSVTVTDNNNCQSQPGVFTVLVRDPLSLHATASPSTVCQGGQTQISAVVAGGEPPYLYTWSPAGFSGSSFSDTPSGSTTYSVTVTDKCGSPPVNSSVIVNVFPAPLVDFIADETNGCAPLLVNFSDLSSPAIQSWAWSFDDPSSGFLNTSSQQNPSHLFNSPGSYSVNLSVVTSDGCAATFTYNNLINVYPNPIASFTAHPNPASTVNPTIFFIDQSLNAYHWSWNFGEYSSASNTSNISSPSHTYQGAGSYTVWLLVYSNNGCIDSVSSEVQVNQDFAFWVPTAFSPNEDGINDIFRPKGINVNPDAYQMYIYDRWGKEIFATRNINHGWDGSVYGSSEPAPQGVYVWVIRFEELNGLLHSLNGRVTLIK